MNSQFSMTTLRKIKQRLTDELSELYEALYAAQEWIEEGESGDRLGARFDSFGQKALGLGGCEPRSFSK